VHPAVVQNNSVVYFSHPVFSQYQTKAPRWCKQLVANALARLLPKPLVRVEAPTSTIVTLNAQPQHNRWVLHVLYYVPERRCDEYDVIEDVAPLYNVPVAVRADEAVKSVTLVPQREAVEFAVEDGYVTFVVPEIVGHQMVALAF
jgi:hypothetical protein